MAALLLITEASSDVVAHSSVAGATLPGLDDGKMNAVGRTAETLTGRRPGSQGRPSNHRNGVAHHIEHVNRSGE
jgi:hypothetical protein